MSRILLSADSTCDLGDELKEKYQVHYYPFHIILEGKDYQDNVDITPEEAADILDGSVTPNIGTLARISRFLNTSIDFLIGSVPYPTIISSEDEEDIVLYYRTMSKTGRRLLMGALEDFKDR